MKKVLVVDDSALMRRVLCDIINSDGRFNVADEAVNGLAALELLRTNEYDVVVLDVNMPRMDGLSLLKELQKENIKARIIMASTYTTEGAQVTLDALELGALDFIHKPDWAYRCREDDFKVNFLRMLEAVSQAKIPQISTERDRQQEKKQKETLGTIERIAQKETAHITGRRIVAIASSTGGPRALQQVIPQMPQMLNAPVVLVQHMPPGFTLSLAQRLNHLSKIMVVEAEEGQVLENGCVYLARSGQHMNLVAKGKDTVVHYSDEPTREGVRPSANYMYESLGNCNFDEIVCVVLTGMGADGTEGILHLKDKKKTYVITQDGDSCVVNGMPKSVVKAGLSNQTVDLPLITQEIILRVGVQ